MVSIPSRLRLFSSALRRDLALKRYGRGANLVAMTGVPSKSPSRSISPMILSEAPLPYISAVSTRVTPSTMLARKASPTSPRSYSLPYPQSLVVPQAQAPIPRGATFSSSARPTVSSLCKASPLVLSPRNVGWRGVSTHSPRCGKALESAPTTTIPLRLSQNLESIVVLKTIVACSEQMLFEKGEKTWESRHGALDVARSFHCRAERWSLAASLRETALPVVLQRRHRI